MNDTNGLSLSALKLFFKNLKDNKKALAAIRISIVSIVIVVSLLYLLPWTYMSTNHTGYISSRINEIVAPIDGEISGLKVHGGDLIKISESIAIMRNDQADYGKLPEMMIDQARDRGELAILQTQISYLIKRLSSLEHSSEDSNNYVLRFLYDGRKILETSLERRASELTTAQLIYGQKRDLNEKGFASDTDMYISLTNVEVAKEGISEVKNQISQLGIQIEAIKHGILIREVDAEIPDANFLSFNVRTELYKIQKEVEGIRHSIVERTMVIKREEGMVINRQYQNIKSPTNSVIYSVEVGNKVFVNKGEPIVYTIDCEDLYVIAFVEQEHIGDIRLGRNVRARILDSDIEINGIIESIKMSHEIGNRDEFILNNHPLNDHDIFIVVKITDPDKIFNPSTYCYIGASVRIQILAGKEPNLLERLLLWVNKR